MPEYQLTVNGQRRTVDVLSDTPLLWVLRDELGLTGTKYGCGIAQCGACTVHIGGSAAYACMTPISSVGDREVLTIEGLESEAGRRLRDAWIAIDVPQCGYCQPGQLMRAAALLERSPAPDEAEIDAWMSPVICRCGAYERIRRAILAARGGAEVAP